MYKNSVGNVNSNFKVFLKACLLKEDKKRLQKFRQLDEEIDANLGGISHLLFGDAKGALKGSDEAQMLEELAEDVTWENPEKMEERILEDICEKAMDQGEYGDLLWVNYQVTQELEDRLHMLEKYIEGFEKARKSLKSGDFQDHLERSEKRLLAMRDALEDLIEEGQIDKADLRNAPAIIVDG